MKIKLDKRYDRGLINLLCYFADDLYLSFSVEELGKSIKNYVLIFDETTIKRTIVDCLDVLSDEEFHYEWVETMLGLKFASTIEWRNWLTLIMTMLKKEAQMIGIYFDNSRI